MKHQKTTLILTIFGILLLIGLTACGGGQAQTQGYASSGTGNDSSQTTDSSDSHADNDTAAKTESKGDAVKGQEAFAACAACHGPTGEGMPGLGKDMTTSEFIAGLSDDELVAFIKVGRDPSDPLNTTGVGMPAKGGNPALSDEDLYNIVAYIRTINKAE